MAKDLSGDLDIGVGGLDSVNQITAGMKNRIGSADPYINTPKAPKEITKITEEVGYVK